MGSHTNGGGGSVILLRGTLATIPEANRPAARSLFFAGFILLALGVFHIFVWLLLGGEWKGAVSWRKPILFGISTGATLLSIAWIFTKMRPQKWDMALSGILSIALILEVALITIQQWRGQESHFNHTSTFDSFVENGMTALIVVATIALFEFTRRAFSQLETAADLQLAIRAGLAFLMLSCLIGFWVFFNGQYQLANGRNPSTFGKAGVPKFPHGVAIHAIQFFPVLCWLFRKLDISLRHRVRLIRFCIGAVSGLLTFSVVQTLLGNARFQWSGIGFAILALTIFLLGPVVWSVIMAVCRLVTASPETAK